MKQLLFFIFLSLALNVFCQYDTAIAILQASRMFKQNYGSVRQNYWVQDVNGGVYQSVNFPETKNYRFDFTGHGAYSKRTWSMLGIKIDDSMVARISINTKSPSIWTVIINVPAGSHKVSLLLINDNGTTNMKLFMGLLYITPVNSETSYNPVIYPSYFPDSLPEFGTRFLKRENFASSQLRGFVYYTYSIYNKANTFKEMSDAKNYGANLLRIFVLMHDNNGSYDFLKGELASIDSLIHNAYLLKMYINLVITQDTNDETFWGNEKNKQSYLQKVNEIVLRYKDSTEIAAISISNEPNLIDHLGEWCFFAQRLTNSIRRIDTSHVIIFPHCSSSMDIWSLTQPIACDNIVYEYHCYKPYQITHQGINIDDNIRTEYPNTTSSPYYNHAYLPPFGINELSATLQPVRSFANKWNTPIYVGEFACVDWAPNNSACNYNADCIALFEVEGWSWSLHSFRQFEPWDHEISPQRFFQYPFSNAAPVISNMTILDQYRTDTTCTMQMLKSYFLLNKRSQ